MFEVCARHFERFVEALASAADDDADADPLEVLSSRGRAYVEYGLENPEPYRILFMQRAGESATGGLTLTAAESFKLLTDAVEECLDRRVFPDGDPFTVACALWASIHGLTSLMISNPDYPWPPLDDLLAVGMWASSGDEGGAAKGDQRAEPKSAPGKAASSRGSSVGQEALLDPVEHPCRHGRRQPLHVVGHPRQGGDRADGAVASIEGTRPSPHARRARPFGGSPARIATSRPRRTDPARACRPPATSGSVRGTPRVTPMRWRRSSARRLSE